MKAMLLAFVAIAIPMAVLSADPIMIIEVFRHGARAPYAPTWDVFKDWSGRYGFAGELTDPGMRMHYVLGRAIANDYPHLISTYDPSKIYVRSTDVNRTIMSAYSQLYGMFYDSGNQLTMNQSDIAFPPNLQDQNFSQYETGNTSLAFGTQPVPVHTLPADKEISLNQDGSCSCLDYYQNYYYGSDAFKQFNASVNGTYELINKYAKSFNITLSTMWDYQGFYDILAADYRQNISNGLNITFNSAEWNATKYFGDWIVAYSYIGYPKLQQITSYNIFVEMLDYLNGKINGTFNRNIVMLSGHDTTLIPVLATLGVVNDTCLTQAYNSNNSNTTCVYPDFAANVITELYNDTAKPYVKFKYNGIYVDVCKRDNKTCFLDEYAKLVDKNLGGYTMQDFQNDCMIPTSTCTINSAAKDSKTDYYIFIAALALLCFAEIVVLIVLLRKKLNNAKSRRDDKENHLIVTEA